MAVRESAGRVKLFFQPEGRKIFAVYVLLSAALSFCFGQDGWWYLIFSFFVGAAVFLYRPAEREIFPLPKYLLIIPLIIFFASRLLPFFAYGPHPLGYDTGFYKYNIDQERQIIGQKAGWPLPAAAALRLGAGFRSIGASTGLYENGGVNQAAGRDPEAIKLSVVESTGSRMITDILIGLGLSDWAILYGFYIFALALAGWLIYLLAKEYFGPAAAFFSVFLYSISSVQLLAYWFMLWKNAAGAVLLLLILLFLKKNRPAYYLAAIPLLGALVLTHRVSAALLLAGLGLYFVLNRKIRLEYRLAAIAVIAVSAAGFLFVNKELVPYLWAQMNSSFKTYYDFFSLQDGIFMETGQFFSFGHSFFYLPFCLLTAILLFKERKFDPPLALLAVCALIIFTHFIFYKRILVNFDMFLLIFFGYSFGLFAGKLRSALSPRLASVFIFILLLLPAGLFSIKALDQKPMISRDKLKSIGTFADISPDLRIMTESSYYFPWLYGFSGHRVIAPGWNDVGRGLADWQKFWAADAGQKTEMLSALQPPFLVYDNGSGFFQFSGNNCFSRAGSDLYLFACR